jgi:hypothetical protein
VRGGGEEARRGGGEEARRRRDEEARKRVIHAEGFSGF